MALFKTNVHFRGTTVIFLTTFTDQNGNVIQPPGANVSVSYPNPSGGYLNTMIPMIQPGGFGGDPVQWYAAWDSRGANPGTVYWSIHSDVPIPVTVTDGQFQLAANMANQIFF